MNVAGFLGIFNLIIFLQNGYIIADGRYTENREEEKILIKKLANIIHSQESKIEKSSESQDESPQEIESNSKEYPLSEIKISKNQSSPMAVPPNDKRYFLDDWSANNNDQHLDETIDKIRYISLMSEIQKQYKNNDEKKNDDSELVDKITDLEDTDDEQMQRQKLYAHLTLNPSFIPFNGAGVSKGIPLSKKHTKNSNQINLLGITYGIVSAIVLIIGCGSFIFYRKIQKKVKEAENVDYPAYGVTGPCKEVSVPTNDRNLVHSAQMYHYQHQKQQITAMEKNVPSVVVKKDPESESDEDDTVYECPGLAPVTGEMEVKNPMFEEDVSVNKPSSISEESKNDCMETGTDKFQDK